MLVELHVLIASLGFYALARSFRVTRIAAVIAAVTFAYTGAVFSRATGQTAIFFGLALVPWAVFFAHRYLETARTWLAAGAGLAIGLGVLAGHFEPPYHAALIVGLFYVLTTRTRRATLKDEVRMRAKGIAVTALVATIVASPQLAYTLPYLGRAYRFTGAARPIPPGGEVSYREFSDDYSGGPESFLSLIDPQRYTVPDGNELFIGLAALGILVAGGLALGGQMRERAGPYAAPLVSVAVVGALAILGPWTPFPHLLYVLPFVAEVRELARYSIMIQLVLCLGLAFALHAIVERRKLGRAPLDGKHAVLIGAVGCFISIDGIYLLAYHAPGSNGWFGVQMVLGGLALLLLAAGTRLPRQPVVASLGLLVVAGSLQNGTRTLGHTSSALYPSNYFARIPAITYAERACAHHRTLVLEEALPSNVGDVFPALQTQNGYGATMDASLYDFISASSSTSPEQTRLLDLRCVITRRPVTIPGYRLGFRDLAHGVIVYVDDDTSPINTEELQPVSARILTQGDLNLRYQVTLARPMTLVLSAITYPGWRLRVNGRPVANRSFDVAHVPVFPELTLGRGTYRLDYSWSGWPW